MLSQISRSMAVSDRSGVLIHTSVLLSFFLLEPALFFCCFLDAPPGFAALFFFGAIFCFASRLCFASFRFCVLAASRCLSVITRCPAAGGGLAFLCASFLFSASSRAETPPGRSVVSILNEKLFPSRLRYGHNRFF